jgi:nitrate reductase NapE component
MAALATLITVGSEMEDRRWKGVLMNLVPDNENEPPARVVASADISASSAKRAQARENRWVAFLFLAMLVWIALLSLLGYGVGWLYYQFR